ncbi:MAG: Na(+)/H(+) antiporter subunit B [Rhodobacterales bacterium]|nr:Na(+)/H(+) antiporter subunit B [Rhodobacterales bacterium]
MKEKPVLRVTSKLLIPPIMLFALYVQFHGDFGPGGGFQAGVIFASAFILYALIFGVDVARRIVPAWVSRAGLSIGVLLYAGTGVAALFGGGNFLDYSVLAHDALHGQHLGINVIEFGVGTTVAAAMVTIFFTFASQSPHDPEDLRDEDDDADFDDDFDDDLDDLIASRTMSQGLSQAGGAGGREAR